MYIKMRIIHKHREGRCDTTKWIIIMSCPACKAAREVVERLMTAPWDYLLSDYEFMIVYATFQRNILFYSTMDCGQLRTLYSRIVSFSSARILMMDALISVYKKSRLVEEENVEWESCDVPCKLLSVITLAIGNRVPEYFVNKCMSSCKWKGYENMVLAAFASADIIRSGTLKYMAVIKECRRGRSSIRVIISLAVTGWMVRLSDSKCTCGTWAQAVDLISCFVSDAETTLAIQDADRISSYIVTLLDLTPPSNRLHNCQPHRPLDYGYIFSELLVTVNSDNQSNTENSPLDCHLSILQHSRPPHRT